MSRGYTWPVPGHHTITSYFGGRSAPTAGASTYHPAIDIGAPSGARVVAAASGKVTQAGGYGGYGNHIFISHGGGYKTGYGHLSSISVHSG